jgi:hypothetical protein
VFLSRGRIAKTAKTKRNLPVRRRVRNAGADRVLSLYTPAKDDMPNQVKRAPKPAPGQRVRESVDRVMAECDKVDAALFEMARATQVEDLPPLTIEEIDTGDGEGGTNRGWAVVSADPQRPLTETQAKEIIAAMQSRGTPAPIGIAAE